MSIQPRIHLTHLFLYALNTPLCDRYARDCRVARWRQKATALVARLEQRAQVVRRRRLAEGFGPRDTEKVAAFMEVEAQTARLAVLKDQDKLVEVELQVRRRRLDRLARLARLARLDTPLWLF